ncbi:hypothetical protein COLO4_07242 [Corchorus olitorius]|uniref:Uncharacterized protein n=1 Tax=Corchorus olitorius TaxID=93759 RepID=A0A1R3KKD6_9ROSI|nr:hypothetical protein COLO4_07242 [Corchorus olitorius]
MASSISSTLPGINDQRKGECMYASCSGVVKQKNERLRWESEREGSGSVCSGINMCKGFKKSRERVSNVCSWRESGERIVKIVRAYREDEGENLRARGDDHLIMSYLYGRGDQFGVLATRPNDIQAWIWPCFVAVLLGAY